MIESHSNSEFPSTCWSRVAHAGNPASPDARFALAKLCEAYWYPLYALIRRKGHPAEQAMDLTQEYFARLLEKGALASADREKGRFRAFLMTDCGRFLIDQHRRQVAARRGGGKSPLPIDVRDAEGRYRFEPSDSMTPDRLFECTWAVTLLGRVLDQLEREYNSSGRAETFEHLKVVLTEGRGAVPPTALAARLGIAENAVYAATHRLKARYREILKEEIAATLDDSSCVDDEIRALFEAVRP